MAGCFLFPLCSLYDYQGIFLAFVNDRRLRFYRLIISDGHLLFGKI